MSEPKRAFLAATPALFATWLALGAAAQNTQNLIRNGGFEDGLTGWDKPTVQLAEDEKAAHSGKRCVVGEVKKKGRSRVIAQKLTLDADRVYRVSFWLRSPERARSIVHLLYGAQGRMEVIQIRAPAKKWQRHQVVFSPRETGEQTLRFAIPSAFGAFGKPGQVFLDDVELVALPSAPPGRNLTNNQGYSDWPCLVADRAGDLWAAWVSYVAPDEDRADPVKAYTVLGADRLRACLIRDGEPKTFEVPGRGDGRVMWPQLVADREGAWLLWSMEVDGAWDVYAAKLNPDGPSGAVRLTNDKSVAVKACGAVDASGRLWVAWEGNRHGGRDIYCTTIAVGAAAPPTRLTENATSDQNPTMCVAASGQVHLAWDSFRDSNYDIHLRRHADGQWGPELRLTGGPGLDRRPQLAACGADVWLAWDNAVIGRYGVSNRWGKRARVAKLVGDKLMAPKGLLTDAGLHTYVELPSLATDEAGRVWVTVRKARYSRGDWDTWLHCLNGAAWGEPILVSGQFDGLTRRAPIVHLNGKLHVIWQTDDRLNRPERIGYHGKQHSNIHLAAIDPASAGPPGGSPELVEYGALLGEQPNALKEYRVRFNEDAPEPFAVDYAGEKLTLYWGLFHEHTELSQCNARGDGSPDTNFAEARDITRLDFCALTDHGQDLIPYDWHHLQKITAVNQDPGRFITFLAEEWAGGRSNVRDPKRRGGYGHRNVILADDRHPRFYDPVDNTPPDKLWEMLADVDQISIPHQLADGGSRTDWHYVDEKNQPVAEIFQTRGSYEYFGAPRQAKIFTKGYSLQEQWAKGVVIGVIASPDHGGGKGKAAVFAPELTREAILEACRKRRTYGTTAAKIFLDVRVNGRLMGELIKVPAERGVTVSVKVIAAGEIKQVEVIKDNRFVYLAKPEGTTAEFLFEDAEPRQERSFYYVRVIQEDEEIAWSSPVWVE